jgi:hypothetical protein
MAAAKEEQQIAEARKARNVELMAAQERMILFGNRITMQLIKIADDWGPTLIKIGEYIMVNVFPAIESLFKWLDSKMPLIREVWDQLIFVFNKYVLPKIEAVGKWFGETWDQLVKAWNGDKPGEVIEVLKKRLADGMDKIWKEIQEVWKIVSPGLIKIWNEDIKPVLVELWTKLMNSMLTAVGDAIKTWLYGPKMTTPEGKANMDRRAKDVEADTPMWLKPLTALGTLMEKTASFVAGPEIAERMRNQTIKDNESILDFFGYRGRHTSGSASRARGNRSARTHTPPS